MGRKLLNTTLELLFLGIAVLIVRENLSLDDWTASYAGGEDFPGNSEVEA